MQKEIELFLTIKQASEEDKFTSYISDFLRIKKQRVSGFKILRKSLDSRNRVLKYYYKINVFIDEQPEKENPFTIYKKVTSKKTAYIVGAGPAGLFAALECIKQGVKPVIFERGKPISERKHDIANLHRNHMLNPDSNYCFGEGGAGTFSDGKLYTRSKKKGDIYNVLMTFVQHGASEEILYDTAPHIGTDVLPRIITAFRNTILENGGEIHFNSKLTDIIIENNALKAIVINDTENINTKSLLLATGHSARDIYKLLNKKKILIIPKPFAMGVRIEHPQELINSIQYHGNNYDKNLPAAQYKIVEQIDGRGVFSFCMCPGGIIVPSATESNQLVVNGMSNSKHNSPYANAGIVVQVNPDDVTDYKEHGPLYLMAFQEALEMKCCIGSKLSQTAPAQRVTDFVTNKLSVGLPDVSYSPGAESYMLNDLLPPFIAKSLQKAFVLFDKKMKGFYTNEAVILAVESRTSSPVRIPRNKDTFEHEVIKGLYPCGEGSGYTGGITSSALDGINCANALSKTLA